MIAADQPERNRAEDQPAPVMDDPEQRREIEDVAAE